METLWDHRFAQRMQRMKSSIIRESLKIIEQPGIISFAGGLPAPEVFPLDQVAEASARILRENGPQALQYGATEGYTPLREYIVQHMARYGLTVTVDNVLITSGSQQALDLLGKVFINRGDRILVEAPTYLGALQAWSAYGAEYISVPSDENGMNTDMLEHALRAGPKFIYVLPNFQNPSGTTLALERRECLVQLAERYGVPILEDDPYVELRFEGQDLTGIAVLDSRGRPECTAHYCGNVIYLGTFSKILAPGLRLAWVIAPPDVIRKLVQAKQGADLHTAMFNQMIAYELARTGFLNRHIDLIRRVYRERRDVMLQAMEKNFPRGVHWTHPKGGLFLWVTVPEGMDTGKLLSAAVERQVAFVPGVSFYPDESGINTMRLNFSNATPEKIQEGIARLGQVLHERIA